MHVRDVLVGPRDEIPFTRHDQELAGASRKIGPGKHVEEALLCCLGVARRPFARVRRLGCGCSSSVLAGSRASNHEESCTTGNGLRRDDKHLSSRHAVRSNVGPLHCVATSVTCEASLPPTSRGPKGRFIKRHFGAITHFETRNHLDALHHWGFRTSIVPPVLGDSPQAESTSHAPEHSLRAR